MWNSKPKKNTHKCRKRKFGQPKVSRGACHAGLPRQYLATRISSKRLEKKWLKVVKEKVDPDDVEW